MLPLSKPSSVRSAPAVQSRAMSLVEAVTNVAVGFGVAVLTQMAVFPRFGLRVAIGDTIIIDAIFTAVSIARSYLLRRGFERLRLRRPMRKAAARGGSGSIAGRRGQSAMR
jgi:hypothetical protein